jgi:hypothetical protein
MPAVLDGSGLLKANLVVQQKALPGSLFIIGIKYGFTAGPKII